MLRETRAVVFGSAFFALAMSAQSVSPSHVDAQWLPDRAYTEGPGIRVGDLELHPGVAIRGGYDTNVYRHPGTSEFPEIGSAILAITPHLNLTTLSAQRRAQGEDAAGASAAPLPPVVFNLGVSATYFHFFKKDVPKNAEVDFDAALSVLPERKVGFDVGASYGRFSRPFTAKVEGNNTYAFDRIQPTLRLRGQSRGGVLKGHIGFAPLFTIFEGAVFDYLNQNQWTVPAGLAWKFLPSTALIFDANYSFIDYSRPSDPRATVVLSDGQRYASRIGINGAVTPHIAVRALAGYGVVLLDRAVLRDKADVVGEAAVTFAWSRKDNVELGYQRQLESANLGGWTQLDRGYLRSNMLFAGVFALTLEAGLAHVNYGRLYLPVGGGAGTTSNVTALGQVDGVATTTREDIRIDAGVHAEYRITNWLALLADFSVLSTLTDFEYFRGQNVPIYPGEFKTFQIFGGVRAHY